MQTQGITEINVSELCREAGVHRTTFYKHFSSVTQFAADVHASLLDEIAAVSEEDLPTDRTELVDAYRQAMVALLDHVTENRQRYRRLFAVDGDFFFQRVVIDLMTVRAARAHGQLVERGAVMGIDEATAARMVGASCAAALGEWAGQVETDSRERAAQVMSALPHWWPRA